MFKKFIDKFIDRIKYIKFNKSGEKSKNKSLHKIKEVRAFINSSSFSRNWLCKFF